MSGGGDCLRRPRCGLLVEAVLRLSRKSPGSPVRRSIANEEIACLASRGSATEAARLMISMTEEPEANVSGLIDTLANRVGERRIYRFAAVASDVPERCIMRIAPLAPNTGEA